jgi:hypothetical protein
MKKSKAEEKKPIFFLRFPLEAGLKGENVHLLREFLIEKKL